MAFPHFGQLKRAWTGGILASEIEKVPAQIGQENPYLRSASLNGISSKEIPILARELGPSGFGAYDPSPMTPFSIARRIVDRLRGVPRRPGGRRGLGDDWEREAERALVAARYRIVERNFRTKRGEIDLIAEENGTLCFVEVKGRNSRAFGSAAESVTLEKQRRIRRAAETYLAKSRGAERPCRFDVVCVNAQEKDASRRVTIFRNAFEAPSPPRRA